jgi:hypothetical protein
MEFSKVKIIKRMKINDLRDLELLFNYAFSATDLQAKFDDIKAEIGLPFNAEVWSDLDIVFEPIKQEAA